MVASTRVQMLGNKSDEILVLMEFLKNPKLAESLAEEVKKLNKLTEDEEKALHESKLLIQGHNKMLAEHEELKKKMADELEKHQKGMDDDRSEFMAACTIEREAIAKERADLAEACAEALAEDERLKKWDNQLKETARKIQGLAGA